MSIDFGLPNLAEITGIAKQFETLSVFAKSNEFASIAAHIHSPWLDMQATLRSLGAFAELQHIGQTLKTQRPFADHVIGDLRVNLGDWRDKITFPESIFGNLGARSSFYIERGFRPELTDFPAAAFEEGLDLAELTNEPPSLAVEYSEPLPAIDEEEVTAFARTVIAYRWLMHFETALRRFIDAQLTRAFGADWPRHQLPNDMYDEWVEKKSKAEKAGTGRHRLICFADFTDYERIICRRDNFKVFAAFFGTRESVRESLQRLYMPRIETMHSRPISQDDELLLYVEIKRLAKAFGC